MKVLKLGTRRSLLAMTQSQWVASQVELNNPGVRVELVGIETKGDRILDVSLRNIEGKEFFVAELDEALRSRAVDFTVHSMKDLSLDRPNDFVLAAVPKREDPRDVIIFGSKAVEKIRNLQRNRVEKVELCLGTSSPRRLQNLPPFLKQALPYAAKGRVEVKFLEIRGNVNTRLKKLDELDGVVLALAGLTRLINDPKAKKELQPLLDGVRFMVLPLAACPTAPAQGALAVECLSERTDVLTILQKLNHSETAETIKRERQVLEQYGGGCHQAFGATSVGQPVLGSMLWVRGKSTEGIELSELRWSLPESQGVAGPEVRALDGARSDLVKMPENQRSKVRFEELSVYANTGCFVAHSFALPEEALPHFLEARIWTPGEASWFRLAEKGYWVEGCADGFGYQWAKPLIENPLFGLDIQLVLTHAGAEAGWNGIKKVVATYSANVLLEPDYSNNKNTVDLRTKALSKVTHMYWSSSLQFEMHSKWLTHPKLVHSCGPGKTYDFLISKNIKPVVFPGPEEWRTWITQKISLAP